MRAPLIAIALIAGPWLAADVFTQARPDLSGRWVLVPDRSVPAGATTMGREFTASQRDGTLTIEFTLYRYDSRAPAGTPIEPAGRETVVYTLNGEETVRQPSTVQPHRAGVMTMTTVETISRAAWAGDQLVIVDHNLSRGHSMDGQPLTSRQAVRRALSVGADGTLTVESLIIADPGPRRNRQETPAPARSVYRKSS